MTSHTRPIDRWAGAMLIVAGVVVIALSVVGCATMFHDPWFRAVADELGVLMDRMIDPSRSLRWLGGIGLLVVGVAEAVASAVLGWLSVRGSRAAMISSMPVVAVRIVLCGLIVLTGFVGVVVSASQLKPVSPTWGWSLIVLGAVSVVFLLVNLVLLWIAQRSARV
jgi:hypothetical protein